VDVERTPHRVDAAREFCAKPTGLDTETVR
jgi:hypothetical protein